MVEISFLVVLVIKKISSSFINNLSLAVDMWFHIKQMHYLLRPTFDVRVYSKFLRTVCSIYVQQTNHITAYKE